MKTLITKAKSILISRRGETLVEGIVSLFIFSVLILGVSSMIVTSLRISQNATETAQDLQNTVNRATEETDYEGSSVAGNSYTIKFSDPSNILGDTVHNLELFNSDGIIAFRPEVEHDR